ncbi:amidohydrolase family protein [Actinophytocola sp. NPDC049390]|uniref:amidohydrolase family protein n=1 Tax=Actinophytocola sp. NPDC049390 TaxID=3363894 RepID=UPI0037B4E1F1
MLVDTHVHLFTRALPLASTAWTAPDVELAVEAFEELMTRHGVTHGVVSAMSLLDDRNAYTIAALRGNPRLRGTVDVGPGTDRRELAALRDDGVVGVRFQWRRRTALPDLTDDDHARLLRDVADLGWHVELNVERDRMPPVLAQLARSGVDVVVDHYGDPCPRDGYATPGGEALLRALDTGRFRVKLSAGYRFPVTPEELAGFAVTLLAHAGPRRVFWGSDAPFVGAKRPADYAGELAVLDRVVPDPVLRHGISAAAHAFYFGR